MTLRPETLTADQVAEVMQYVAQRGKKAGQPRGEDIRALYRTGRFPPPIDPTLHARKWRWSIEMVEDYRTGQWIDERRVS